MKPEERVKVELQTNVKLAEETKQRFTELERQRLKLKADHRAQVVKVKEAEKVALENRVDVLSHQVESLESVESATYSEHAAHHPATSPSPLGRTCDAFAKPPRGRAPPGGRGRGRVRRRARGATAVEPPPHGLPSFRPTPRRWPWP